MATRLPSVSGWARCTWAHDGKHALVRQSAETGERTPDGDPPDQRLYVVFRYEAEPGVAWKFDLSLRTVAAPSAPGELLATLETNQAHRAPFAMTWCAPIWPHALIASGSP